MEVNQHGERQVGSVEQAAVGAGMQDSRSLLPLDEGSISMIILDPNDRQSSEQIKLTQAADSESEITEAASTHGVAPDATNIRLNCRERCAQPDGERDDAATALLTVPPGASQKWIRRIEHCSTQIWALEFSGWAISFVSMMTIVIILSIYNGKALAQWPLGITINTVIATFGTISQTAMLVPVTESVSQLKWIWFTTKARRLSDFDVFDKASRGAEGSLKLLLNFRFLFR
jgi:hypothetical protein